MPSGMLAKRGGCRAVAKKAKTRLTGMRKGMHILGWFHYVLGFFQLLMAGVAVFTLPDKIGAGFREAFPDLLSWLPFLSAFDDRMLGILTVIAMLVRGFSEFVIGWIWCRKARNTVSQVLAVILSGFKIVHAVWLILYGGLLSTKWADIYTLILNGVSFALAFWMHGQYKRTQKKPRDGLRDHH